MTLVLWAVTWFLIGFTFHFIGYRAWLRRLGLKGHMMLAMQHIFFAIRMVEKILAEADMPEQDRRDFSNLLEKMDQLKQAVVEDR